MMTIKIVLMLSDTAIITNIIVISSKLVVAILIAFYVQIRPYWILPEVDKLNCVHNIESWYNSEIGKVNNLPLSQESKIASVESYRLEANKKLKWCN